MLRLIMRLPLYLARQSRKPRAKQTLEEDEQEQQYVPVHTLQSQFRKVKQKYEQLDKQPLEEPKNDPEYKMTMEFVKSMLQNQQDQNKVVEKKKDKVEFKDKLKKMGIPTSLLEVTPPSANVLDQFQAINSQQGSNPQTQIQQMLEFERKLKTQIIQNKSMTPQQFQRQRQIQLRMAQQDMLLGQIMKVTKQRELKSINVIDDKPDEYGVTQKEKKLIMRQQKIIESLRNKQDPSEVKFDVTRQDLLKMKYSPQIIEKAKNYTTHQLAYFKELIVNQNQDTSPKLSSLKRRRFKDPKDEENWNKLQGKIDYEHSPIQNSYKTMTGEEGLVQFEDVEFYKQKALTQIQQKQQLSEEDQIIMKQLDKDLGEGNKISDVFLDEVVYPFESKLEKGLAMDDTSFAKQKKQIKGLTQRLDRLGISYSTEEIYDLSKNNLFEQKRFLQEQQNFQKYLHKKQKKKNMKKELKQIHKSVLKDDINFDKVSEPTMTVKQLKQSNNLEMLEDNYQKVNQYYQQKQSTLVQETPQEKSSKIHHIKTFKNMYGVVASYFASGLFNHNVEQLSQVQILQVIPNKTNTVLNIFWNLEQSYMTEKGILPGTDNYSQMFEAEKKKMQTRLVKQSGYISGKLTQLLRLRYGPDIRFHFDQKTKETQQAVGQLKKYLKEIAMVEVEQYQKKGLITSEEKELEYFEKLLTITKTKISDYNSRKQILSKKYRKAKTVEKAKSESKLKKAQIQSAHKLKKQKRVNPIFQGLNDQEIPLKQTVSKRKKTPVEKLWDTIDML